MRKESEEFLEECLKFYQFDGIDSIFDLYKQYSSFEVASIYELKNSVIEFCEYLRRNVSKIKSNVEISEGNILKTIGAFNRSIAVAAERYLSEGYKNFSKLAFEVSPNKVNESILDVGAGKIPSTSLWLAQNMKKVTSMDDSFYLSKVSLKNMGVESKEMYFNSATPVDEYSFVIGRCPCYAIKHMVKKCSEANVPYLIKLCDCDIVVAEKYMKNKNVWADILPEYDKNVKLYNDFAYNLDISERQLVNLIERYDSRPPLRAKRVKIVRYYNKGELVSEEEVAL